MKKKNKVDQDMESKRIMFQKIMGERYKRPVWDQIKEAVGVFFLAIGLLLILTVVVILIVMLIENPVSLAIICLTIFLIWVWRKK